MSSVQIRQNLETALMGVIRPGGSTDMVDRIVWENIKSEPVAGECWVRLSLVFDTQRPATMGRDRFTRHDGNLNVAINVPEHEGAKKTDEIADVLFDGFPVDRVLDNPHMDTKVRIAYAERGYGMLNSPFYTLMSTIRWYAFTRSPTAA